eukprot:scaffold6416_cov66-Phaeocystis_antarctica.AAC.4
MESQSFSGLQATGTATTRQTDQDRPTYKQLLGSNGQRRHTNVRMHMQTPTPHTDTADHVSPRSPLRASLDPRDENGACVPLRPKDERAIIDFRQRSAKRQSSRSQKEACPPPPPPPAPR